MSTYRERRLRRAEKYRDWAGGAEAKAEAAHAAVDDIASRIPFGQPILVGHHSEKRARRDQQRIQSGMDAAVENNRKAEEHRRRADEIERQAANAIYDDDPDAIERLQAKLARLEARREAMKAANKAFRAEHRVALKAMSAYERNQAVPHPAWEISNVGGVITSTRQRLERLQAPERGRRLIARRDGECRLCGGAVAAGDRILYFKRTREVEHDGGCPA